MTNHQQDFKTFYHGYNSIRINSGSLSLELKPDEFHMNENGSRNDGPVMAIVMHGTQLTVVGRISIEMLQDVFKEFGYKLEKI